MKKKSYYDNCIRFNPKLLSQFGSEFHKVFRLTTQLFDPVILDGRRPTKFSSLIHRYIDQGPIGNCFPRICHHQPWERGTI